MHKGPQTGTSPSGVSASLEAFLCTTSSWKPSQTTQIVGIATQGRPWHLALLSSHYGFYEMIVMVLLNRLNSVE